MRKKQVSRGRAWLTSFFDCDGTIIEAEMIDVDGRGMWTSKCIESEMSDELGFPSSTKSESLDLDGEVESRSVSSSVTVTSGPGSALSLIELTGLLTFIGLSS